MSVIHKCKRPGCDEPAKPGDMWCSPECHKAELDELRREIGPRWSPALPRCKRRGCAKPAKPGEWFCSEGCEEAIPGPSRGRFPERDGNDHLSSAPPTPPRCAAPGCTKQIPPQRGYCSFRCHSDAVAASGRVTCERPGCAMPSPGSPWCSQECAYQHGREIR